MGKHISACIREKALAMVAEGTPVAKVAHVLGIHENSIYRWLGPKKPTPAPSLKPALDDAVRALAEFVLNTLKDKKS